MGPNTQSPTNSRPGSATSEIDLDAQEEDPENNTRNTSQSVVVRGLPEMKVAIYDPGVASSIIEELLADWTVLTGKEIESVTNKKPGHEQKETDASHKEEGILHFQDAVGRKFKFPFYRVKTWEVNVLEPHVIEEHFDLMGPDGDIILPIFWEDRIEPGMAITMAMWPMDKLPPLPGKRERNVKSRQPPNPEQASSQQSPGQPPQPKQSPHKSTAMPPVPRPLNVSEPPNTVPKQEKPRENLITLLKQRPEEIKEMGGSPLLPGSPWQRSNCRRIRA
ncbi:hypothetical protein QQX98_002077 [Neonectria punicea]|uniref:Ubiquitin-like domain-containing protein n=1 Tax=Neonectria punicea TaxID=979145 RepID=A0ABR1HL39_9HYPO